MNKEISRCSELKQDYIQEPIEDLLKMIRSYCLVSCQDGTDAASSAE